MPVILLAIILKGKIDVFKTYVFPFIRISGIGHLS